MKYKLVYLEWEDAKSIAGWETNQGVVDFSKKRYIVENIGWLLKESKEYLTIAGSHKEVDKDTEELWGDLSKIPKTWIRKRKILKI